ncbi:hypothetical protein [Streptomyces violaceusniger]|uniref:Uncharacterized protein n=1 Tax=Streptomyces violaceusniger TaxID=68280 RepID=A0A4D4KX76_STRVO|nr:hypothetical protein SVIO_018030 [Streptomyces violaceusniger]
MGWTPLHTGLTLIPRALGAAVAVLFGGGAIAEKLGRAALHIGLSIAVVGLPGLWWSTAHWGTDLTSLHVLALLLVGLLPEHSQQAQE